MDYAEPTLLDVIYSVLEQSYRPLSPREISTAAASAGYDLRVWEISSEIDAHIETYGVESPFVQVGRTGYWLDFAPQEQSIFLEDGSSQFLKAVTVVALIVAVSFAWLVLSSKPSLSASPGSQPVQQVLVEAAGQPVEEIASLASGVLDPDWWLENAVNQINSDTQSVARSILSNYYNTCGPAVISMVVSYYREQAGQGGGVTPADVLTDARAQLGYFLPPYNSGLLDFHNLDDLAGFYGLERVNPTGYDVILTTDELLEGLRQGHPAIAGMRYGYSGGSYVPKGGSGIYNHFVVVIGIQVVDGQEHLLILNNHPGKYLTDDSDVQPELISIESFEDSWLIKNDADYGSYGYAAFYMPSQ